MAVVVFVHGIAQEQLSADWLESQWLPALAGGLRNAGFGDIADQLWRDARPGQASGRMAFYGNLFLDPDAQGAGDVEDLDPEALQIAEELAEELLRNAQAFADDPRDQATATRELLEIDEPDASGRQGVRAALRGPMNALAKLNWFAPVAVGIAGKTVNRTVAQVSRYLTDESIRDAAQNGVLSLIDEQTRVIIGHSLGSVVAFEALHRTHQPVTFITVGSPLGLRTIVYDRLRPQPPHVPACVTSWHNFVDTDDLIAAHIDLAPFFPPAPGLEVAPITAQSLDNGAKPHDATHYLAKRSVGKVVAQAMAGTA